jgi:hypothetical protein
MYVAEEDHDAADAALIASELLANASAQPLAADNTAGYVVEAMSARALTDVEMPLILGTTLSARRLQPVLGSDTEVPTDELWAAAALQDGFVATATVDSSPAFRLEQVTATLSSEAQASSQAHSGFQPEVASLKWQVLRATVTVPFAEPVFIRVRARTAFGDGGAVSLTSGVVTSTCTSVEYLTTNLELDEWRCTLCPDQAICGGFSANNVTARPGWWRVPWSSTGLGFAACDPPGACVGAESIRATITPAANTSTTAATGATIRTRQAVLDASSAFLLDSQTEAGQLVPAEMEGCQAGRTGILCQACAPGYHADVTGGCAECGDDNSSAIFLFAGVTTAALLVVALFVTRAVSSSEGQAALAAKMSREELEFGMMDSMNPILHRASMGRRQSSIPSSGSLSPRRSVAGGRASMLTGKGEKREVSSALSKRSLQIAAQLVASTGGTGSAAKAIRRSNTASKASLAPAPPAPVSPRAPSLAAIGRVPPRPASRSSFMMASAPNAQGADAGTGKERKRRGSRMQRLSVAIFGGKDRPKLKKKSKKIIRAGMLAMVLKLIFNHVQLLSIISGVRLAWPPAVLVLFEAGEVTSSFSTAGLGLECFVGSDAATAVGRAAGVVISSPSLMLWASLVLGLQMVIWSSARRPKKADSEDDEEEDNEEDQVGSGSAAGSSPRGSMSFSTDSPLSVVNPALESGSAASKHPSGGSPSKPAAEELEPVTCGSACALWGERVAQAAILIGFVTHASVTRSAFGLLACRRLFPTGQEEDVRWVLTQDPNVDCSDPLSTASRLTVALPAIVLMTLGMPAIALYALMCPKPVQCLCGKKDGSGSTCVSRLQKQLKRMIGLGTLDAAQIALDEEEDDEGTAHLFEARTIRRWGFLFQGFRRRNGAQVWEVVNMARKTLVAGATVLLASGGTLEQAMAALCVAVVFLVMHATVQPYELPTLNRLETAALTAACVTLAAVPILVSSPWDPQSPPLAATIATVLIVGCNAFVVFAAVGVVIMDILRRSVKRARKNVKFAKRKSVLALQSKSGAALIEEEDEEISDLAPTRTRR